MPATVITWNGWLITLLAIYSMASAISFWITWWLQSSEVPSPHSRRRGRVDHHKDLKHSSSSRRVSWYANNRWSVVVCWCQNGLCHHMGLWLVTSAKQSNLAKSSFRVCTSSWAVTLDERAVNPLMSANRILWIGNIITKFLLLSGSVLCYI